MIEFNGDLRCCSGFAADIAAASSPHHDFAVVFARVEKDGPATGPSAVPLSLRLKLCRLERAPRSPIPADTGAVVVARSLGAAAFRALPVVPSVYMRRAAARASAQPAIF